MDSYQQRLHYFIKTSFFQKSNMNIRKEEGRVFNLALKKRSSEMKEKVSNGDNLQTITQIPENKSCQQIADGRCKNIFEAQKCYHQNMLTSEKVNQYNILCKKQFDSYNSRIKKIKNVAIAGVLRLKVSQSFLSSCKNTGTFCELPPNNGLLKEQLHQFYVKLKNNRVNGQVKKEKCLISQSERFNQSIPSSIHKKHEKYKNTWQMISNSTDRHKLNSWSKNNTLQSHRKKIEQLTNLAIKNEKQNMKPISWVSNLRNPQPLNLFLKDKSIESIERQGIKLRGENKLEKEYNWINEKKINHFDPIDNKEKFVGKLGKASQKQKKGLGLILENLQNHRRLTSTNAQ